MSLHKVSWLVSVVSVGLSMPSVMADTRYVCRDNPTPASPYTNWATAARTIQDAIDAAASNDLILVTNGVYDTGGRAVQEAMTNRVAIDKPVAVRSVNGPAVTTIKGQGPPGDTAVRCAYVGTNATLTGFLLTNGSTRTQGDYYESVCGGGALCEATAVLSNCTLSGNLATYVGGGAHGGTLNNCTLSGNAAYEGGGAGYGTLNNCTLSGNAASSGGGGAYGGTLNNCALSGNAASSSGGGVRGGTLNNCTLAGNTATYGGGADGGMLNNCTLAGNSATYGGGTYSGLRNNCTLAGNSATYGGGAYIGTLNNCIAYYNTALTDPNYSGGTWSYSCTTPLPAGPGNIAVEPALASWSHLSAGSPCLGAGSAVFASGVDLDGEAWRIPPSMGCDEVNAGAVTGALQVAVRASPTNVAVGFPVTFTAHVDGRTAGSAWTFGDGTPAASNRPLVTHAFAAPGGYEVTLRAFNESYPGGVAATARIVVVEAAVHYVRLDSAAPVSPYTNWATAATGIQAAIDAATQAGALILVSNGVYDTGGRVVHGAMTNRVVIDKLVAVRSVNGPGVTTIKGNGPRGDMAARCVYVGTHATLSGFLLTNGNTRTAGDYDKEQSGGGAWCESGAVLSNCTLAGNAAWNDGGGVYRGTLIACTLAGNSTDADGGGAYYSTLIACTLSSNSAPDYGGGAYFGTLNDCTLSGNTAYDSGGGTHYSALSNCTLSGNFGWSYGGGANGGTLHDCTLSGNRAMYYGGGASQATLNRCTLTGNEAGTTGGGSYYGTLSNCMLTGNTASAGGGAAYGTLTRCTLTGNAADSWGGGSYYGTLTDCTLTGNTAKYGGGAYDGTLTDCTLSGNAAAEWGGGARRGTLSQCTLTGNSASNYGGGADESTLNNCTLTGNAANYGGGTDACALNNCTLTGNAATNYGGGSYYGTLTNCIVYYNTAPKAANYTNSTLNHSCTTPIPAGTGHITNEPQFVSLLATNLRLLATSPCIDAGTNQAWMTGAVDLDGHPRIVSGRVDMGAYEDQGSGNPDTDGDGMPDSWETAHGLNPVVSNAPTANADGDPFTDWQEYVADTDPTNAAAYWRVLETGLASPSGLAIRFTSSASRVYTLLRTTNLVDRIWTNVPGQGPRAGLGGLDTMQDTNVPPPFRSHIYRVDAGLP